MGKGPLLSHIRFADDTILFIDKSWRSCKGIKVVLLLFELFSGLKINFNKSSLFASKGAKQLQCKFADYIGCPAKDWPLNYPGHDISPVRRNRRLWAPLVNKFKLKLSHWKGRSLNKAGRLVMLEPRHVM